MASDESRGLVGGSVLLAASRVWAQVASGLLFLATSIAITPQEFGEFAIATSIFGALAVFVGQGTYEYVIKARDSANAAPTVFFLNIGTAGFASLAAFAISLIVPHIVQGDKIPKILLLLIPAFFLMALTALMESVVMKHGAIQKVARTTIVADTVSLGMALGSLAMGAGVYSLVVQRVVREFVIMVTYGVSNHWAPRFVLDLDQVRHAVGFARGIVGIRLIGLGSTAIVDVTIGAFLGASEAGIYRLVARLLTIGSDVLFQPFRAALWVRLPPLQDDVPAFRKVVLDLVEVFGLGMFAAMVGMALIAGPMFELFFKPEWHSAAPLVAILAAGRLLYVPGMAAEVIFALRNQMRFLVQFSVVSAIAGVAVTLASAHFGLTVFVIAGVLMTLALQVYMVPVLTRCMDLKVVDYLPLFGRLMMNATAMCIVVVPLLLAEQWLGAPSWLQFGSGVLAGAAVYILAARRLTPVGYEAYAAGVVSGLGGLRRIARRPA